MKVINLNEEKFESTVTAPGIVVIDWWADWCGPCRAFAPIFEKAAERHPEMTFAKVNTEESQGLSAAFQIRSIPTLMVFRDGILLFNQPGMLPARALDELLDRVAALDMEEVRRTVQKSRETNGEQRAEASAI